MKEKNESFDRSIQNIFEFKLIVKNQNQKLDRSNENQATQSTTNENDFELSFVETD